ncbi:MAG TPA: ATP-binding protein [Acidimicrobiia bacterium]|nr:ATP-binding protein [Acidimicrobiia bacterium]
MDERHAGGAPVRPVEHTLRLIVVLYRILAAAWSLILILVVVADRQEGDRGVLAAAAVLAVGWAGATGWFAARGWLGRPAVVVADGVVVLALSVAGLFAGAADFVSGGYPGSWLFVVAFGYSLRWVMAASGVLVAAHTFLHLAMGLSLNRTAGTLQFVVLGLTVGWAFDALRERERLRLEAEDRLEAERRAAVRLEQGTRLARTLHDSVLQTLKAIHSEADNPGEVRYLARWQERALRRTIEELRSEFPSGFRVSVLSTCDAVEGLFRGVTIRSVIRNDAEMTDTLRVALEAAHEALTNAAKHSGVPQIDLYAEVVDASAVVNVRDRGTGFEPADGWGRGIVTSIVEPVEQVGGTATIASRLAGGTEVTIRVPLA